MNYKDNKEFLDSLVKSGENVHIVFNTSNGTIVVNLIWNDETTIGVKFVIKEQYRIKNLNIADVVTERVKEKITTYYKSAIESISTEWKEVK